VGLILDQLRYAEEVRSFDEVPMEDADVKEAELKLARQLIEQSSADEFEPEKYTDEVRERMLELIQQKVEGEEITVQPAEAPTTQIIDLMAALKASLGQAGDEGERKPASRAGKKAARKTPTRKKAAEG
jgi:DNA end-binding protein Ku